MTMRLVFVHHDRMGVEDDELKKEIDALRPAQGKS